MTLTQALIEDFSNRPEPFKTFAEILQEKPQIVNWSCDGSCGTLIEDYNRHGERCAACPTPNRKFRKKVKTIK